jgi:biopolymer transport protein ExbD
MLVVALALAVSACRAPKAEMPPGPIAKIFVQTDGTVLLNGKPTTRDNLKKELANLKARNGSVWYSRANLQGDPPPHAMDVMQAIIDARLPVRLTEKPE